MAGGEKRIVSLRTALWMATGSAAFVGVFFAGMMVARAKPEPGGGTEKPLSFAGTLKQNGQAMTGKQSIAFTFHKGAASCSTGPQEVDVDEGGHFVAPIALGDAEGACPSGFFDGSDVTLEVSVKGATFSGDVSPVPYTKYAEEAGHAIDAEEAVHAIDAEEAGHAKSADAAGMVQPREGWHQVSVDRYVYSMRWSGGIPPCVGGVTTIPVGGPDSWSRDHLWTGTASVFAHVDPQSPSWQVQVFHYVHVFGHTTGGSGLQVVPVTPGGAATLTITRPDDFSNALFLNIPCGQQFMALYVYFDLLVLPPGALVPN